MTKYINFHSSNSAFIDGITKETPEIHSQKKLFLLNLKLEKKMSKLPPAPSKKNKKLNNRGTHSIFDKSGQKGSDKKHEMFTSTGGSGLGTGVLRPVKGNMDRDAVANDPNYLNKLMQNQQQQGIKYEIIIII